MPAPSQVWLPAPTGGGAPSLPPDQLKDNVGRSLRNFLVHHPGRVVPRGSIGGTSATLSSGSLVDTTSGGAMLQAATFEDYLFIDYRAPSAGPLVDHWRVPINRPTTAGELAQPALGATASRAVDLNTGTVTDISNADPRSQTGISIARLDDALYGVTYGGTSTAVPGGVAPLNNIRKQNALGNDVAVLSANGPLFVQAVFTHYGRVWAAAARTPGQSDYDLSAIHYTNPGGTTAWTDVVTDWQDPETGEANRIEVGASNDSDFVVGFGRANGHMLVFKRYSVWILYGTAPSNFTLRQLRTNSGCVDLRSIAVCDEGTYFASQLGYELFDGTSFKLVSEPVSDEWLPVSNAGVAGGTVNHAYIAADPLPNGYLHIALGTDSTTASAADGTTLGWLFHRPSASWSELRTALTSALNLGAAGCLHRVLVSRSHIIAVGGSKWAKASGLTYGVDPAVGLVDQTSAAALDVTLTWVTRLVNLGGRWATAALHALTLDAHEHHVSASAGPAAWATLAAADSGGTSLMPATNVDSYPSPGPLRSRQFFSRTSESTRGDVTVTLTSASGATAATRIAALSLYGLGIAFIPGRERHVS